MEGFLQSLKFSDAELAAQLRGRVGYAAWRDGQLGNDWKESQVLYWNGFEVRRNSRAYQDLLTKAYDAWYDANPRIAELLLRSVGQRLRHLRGSHDTHDSVLVEAEYICQLERLRFRALEENAYEKLHRDQS
jgi:hypothetical protein